MRNIINNVLNQRYKFIKILGQGSLSVVGLFEDMEAAEKVAIKELPAFEIEPSLLEQARRETEILNKLHHQNIICTFDSFEISESYYIVMEYCNRGVLTSESLKRNFPNLMENRVFKEEFYDSLIFQLISALDYLHSLKFVHRDLKNQNVLILQNQDNILVKLADFGSSSSFKGNHGSFVGTYEFIAPEVFERKTYDKKADIWSLGCLIYYLVANEVPFATAADTKAATLSRPISDLGCSEVVREIIHHSLKESPSDRLLARDLLAFFRVLSKPVSRLILQKQVSCAVFGQNFFPEQIKYQNYNLEFFSCSMYEPFYDCFIICATDTLADAYLREYLETYIGSATYLALHTDRQLSDGEIEPIAEDFEAERILLFNEKFAYNEEELIKRILITSGKLESSRLFRSKSTNTQ